MRRRWLLTTLILCVPVAALAEPQSLDFDQGIRSENLRPFLTKTTAEQRVDGQSALCSGRGSMHRRVDGAIPNPTGVLWRVTALSPNASPSYVFATQHSNDSRVVRLLGKAAPFFAASKQVFTEVDMSEDQQRLYAARSLLPQDADLSRVIGPELFAESVRLLDPYGVSEDQARKMKIWAVFNTLSRPLKIDRMLVLDQIITNEANRQGKPVSAIQKASDITDTLDTLPEKMQIEMLKDAVCEYASNQEESEALTQLYAQQDIGGMLAYTLRTVPANPEHADLFMERMVYGRSAIMAERLAPEMNSGGVFVAVGAMHLPGDRGLLRLLQERGFKVAPVNLDDPAELPATDPSGARRNVRRLGPGDPELDGDVPNLVDIDAIAKTWTFVKKLGGASSDLPAPRIHFDAFAPYSEDLDWLTWQRNWETAHPEVRDLHQNGQIGFFYSGTRFIQLSPAAFTVSYSRDPITGLQRDFGGFGYYETAHEMLHYVLEAAGVPVERHHRVMYCEPRDGKTLMEDAVDYLGSIGAVTNVAFLKIKIRQALPIYCGNPAAF